MKLENGFIQKKQNVTFLKTFLKNFFKKLNPEIISVI